MTPILFAAALLAAGPAVACSAHDSAAPAAIQTAQATPHAHGHDMSHGATVDGASGALGPLTIDGAYARAAAASGGASAAYMTIATGGGGDRLIAAASPAAELVELHTHTLDADGVARMRQVPAIEVAPGQPAELKPGGYHIMLMGLTQKLEPGAAIDVTLTFEKAGSVTLTIPVRDVRGGHGAHSG